MFKKKPIKYQNITNKQLLIVILIIVVLQVGLFSCFLIFNSSSPINIALMKDKVDKVSQNVDKLNQFEKENNQISRNIEKDLYIYKYQNTTEFTRYKEWINIILSNQNK